MSEHTRAPTTPSLSPHTNARSSLHGKPEADAWLIFAVTFLLRETTNSIAQSECEFVLTMNKSDPFQNIFVLFWSILAVVCGCLAWRPRSRNDGA